MSGRKDAEKLIRQVKKQGFRVEETKDGWAVYEPHGTRIVHIHRTPNDRSIRNYRSDLRKLGYKL